MLKKLHLFIPAVALILLGAGCASSAPTSSVTTSGIVSPTNTDIGTAISTVPVVTSTTALPSTGMSMTSTSSMTTSTATASSTAWTRYTDAAHHLSFQYPHYYSIRTNMIDASDTVEIDLGTALIQPTQESVPTRILGLKYIAANDPDIQNGYYSDQGWPVGGEGFRKQQFTFDGRMVDLTVENDAGAGNYYTTYYYSLKDGNQYAIFAFTIHSADCLNYPNPTVQCVSMDETRDAALFPVIMRTVRVDGV